MNYPYYWTMCKYPRV